MILPRWSRTRRRSSSCSPIRSSSRPSARRLRASEVRRRPRQPLNQRRTSRHSSTPTTHPGSAQRLRRGLTSLHSVVWKQYNTRSHM